MESDDAADETDPLLGGEEGASAADGEPGTLLDKVCIERQGLPVHRRAGVERASDGTEWAASQQGARI